MDIIFDIVDHIAPNTIIILTIVFTEKFNVSIGKDINSISIYFYESDKRNVLKFYGSPPNGSKYVQMKKIIQEQIDNTPFKYISGVSNIENKKYLSKYFIISDNLVSDSLINVTRQFI